jgi:hypothetical protein
MARNASRQCRSCAREPSQHRKGSRLRSVIRLRGCHEIDAGSNSLTSARRPRTIIRSYSRGRVNGDPGRPSSLTGVLGVISFSTAQLKTRWRIAAETTMLFPSASLLRDRMRAMRHTLNSSIVPRSIRSSALISRCLKKTSVPHQRYKFELTEATKLTQPCSWSSLQGRKRGTHLGTFAQNSLYSGP